MSATAPFFYSNSPSVSDYRGGVAAKLRNAFIGISLFTLLSAAVGIASFEVIERAQDQVLDRSLPAALAAEKVATQGLSIVAATPALLAAATNGDLARETEKIERARQGLLANLLAMRDLGVDSVLLGGLQADLTTVFENLDRQVALVGQRNELRSQITAKSGQALANAEALIVTLKPSIVDASAELLARSDEIRDALAQPGAVGRQTLATFEELADVDLYAVERLTEMRFRAENVINHIDELLLSVQPDGVAAIRDELSIDLRSLVRSTLEIEQRPLRDRISQTLKGLSGIAHDADSIFELKLALLGIDRQLDWLGEENRSLADRLQSHVDQLLAAGRSLIAASSAEARQTVALGYILLIAIAFVAVIVAIIVTWKYVLQDVAGRIRRLASITRNLAQGNVEVAVDVAGDDELGEMADAVRVFRANASDLRRSNAELEQFAYVASHDLKAPLRGVSNLASWIEEDLADALQGESKAHMALLHGRINRMEQLLEDLLQYSRVGREKIEARDVDLDQLVPEIFRMVAPAGGFQLKVLGILPRFETASAPLEKVFRNLIGNAIKHHDAGTGTIEVGVTERDETYEFMVRDDGPGIAERYQEKIFSMFQTLKSRDEVEGSGMGLAIVKKSVESLGCKVIVESEPDHTRGTTFRFTWPKRWRDPAQVAHAA